MTEATCVVPRRTPSSRAASPGSPGATPRRVPGAVS